MTNLTFRVAVSIFPILLLRGTASAQTTILDRAPELQKIAKLASSGALGCGPSDYSRVFKHDTGVDDLMILLKARVRSIREGEVNPMSGQVSQLAYAILSELPRFRAPKVIPTVAELLRDKDEVIRGWAAISLYRMAENDDGLKARISQIQFPRDAVQSASGRGAKPPDWAIIVD